MHAGTSAPPPDATPNVAPPPPASSSTAADFGAASENVPAEEPSMQASASAEPSKPSEPAELAAAKEPEAASSRTETVYVDTTPSKKALGFNGTPQEDSGGEPVKPSETAQVASAEDQKSPDSSTAPVGTGAATEPAVAPVDTAEKPPAAADPALSDTAENTAEKTNRPEKNVLVPQTEAPAAAAPLVVPVPQESPSEGFVATSNRDSKVPPLQPGMQASQREERAGSAGIRTEGLLSSMQDGIQVRGQKLRGATREAVLRAEQLLVPPALADEFPSAPPPSWSLCARLPCTCRDNAVLFLSISAEC